MFIINFNLSIVSQQFFLLKFVDLSLFKDGWRLHHVPKRKSLDFGNNLGSNIVMC